MGVLVRQSYFQASASNLATDLARYGSAARWRGVYYRGEKIGFTVGQTYFVSGWIRALSPSATSTIKCDTDGGTSYASAELTLATVAGSSNSLWVKFDQAVTPTGTSMTFFLDAAVGASGAGNVGIFQTCPIKCG